MSASFYAPVLIHTLCRYEHFKRCLESLSRCTDAEETEVFVGLDYPAKESHRSGYEKIREYLDNCGDLGFKALHVIKRPHNYGFGPNGNAMSLRRDVFKEYDRIIVSEDDNEFAPAFLDFMNKALEKYHNDDRVLTVGGFTGPVFEGIASEGVIFTYPCCAWGLGLWRHKEEKNQPSADYYANIINDKKKSWRLFKSLPACWVLLHRMVTSKKNFGDIKRETYNFMNNTFQVRPYTSLVRNWGNDGSGVHCVDDRGRLSSIHLSDCRTIDLGDCEVKLSVSQWKMFFYDLPPANTLHGWMVLGKYTFIYLKSLFH